MIKLVPMSEEAFSRYLNWSVKNYADEKVKSGNWPQEGSLERSEKEFKRLLKDGLKTEKNYLYTAMDGDVDAGMLWIAIIKNDGEHDIIWIYDIMVNQDMRGKGYGFQIMNALEEKAKELGQSSILLHVFGHNTPAIELYKKCGYVISNMVMQKNIEIK